MEYRSTCLGSQVLDNFDNFRNHIPRALDHNSVAFSNVLAVYFVLIMQCGSTDLHSTNIDWLHDRHGC